jgi:beta-glucanase (GH16 family)
MDATGNSFQQTFTATAAPDPFNGGPFLREVPDYEVVPGESITIELNSVDVEGDAVTYVFDVGSGTQTAAGNTITFNVSSSFAGEAQIAVAVRPETTSNTQDVFDLQLITLSAVETTPVVTAFASDSSADENGLDAGSIQFDGAIPVLRDDFDGTALDLSVWNLAEPGPSSIVGRTQLQTVDAPEVSGGLLRLRVDSFNPFSPGNTFLGTGISTDEAFVRSDGLVFETRARLINDGLDLLDRGLVASFFSFGLDEGVRDEISLDLLSNDVLADPVPSERVRTSSSNDEPLGQSAVAGSVGAAGLDATVFNTYRIEWQPTRVEWYVNDVLVRLESGAVPDDPMNVGLNFFAPEDSGIGTGFDASLQPVNNSSENETWFFEVDFVEIRRPLAADLTIAYSSIGSAVDGSDFSTGGSLVVIGAATSSATVPVNVLQDTGTERTESATLSIDANATYTVGTPSTATVLIADDDGSADVEVVLVLNPTTTDTDGEVDTLPTNEVWIDEWDEFFVEVWARVPQSDGVGVVTASADLTYNTDYFTATGVEFGTPFTIGQSFTIDDVNGRVDAITATADRTDAGENRFVLLARVAFASIDTDQVPLNSQSGYVTPFNDLDIGIENIAVDVTDAGSVAATTGTLPQTEVWPVMYDLDDSHTVGFGDLPTFSSVFNQLTSSSTDVFQADFDRGGSVGFGDVTLLATAFNRSRASTGRQTYEPDFPDEWRPVALQAAISGDSVNADTVNTALSVDSNLQVLAAAAVEAFRESGLNDAAADELENVTIEVADLPGRQLGVVIDGRIVIDINGAGLGWFVDLTLYDSAEFDSAGKAVDDTARNRYDLATVIAHEFGHLLGFDHGAAGELMDDTLNPGERRLTGLDEQFSESLELLDL